MPTKHKSGLRWHKTVIGYLSSSSGWIKLILNRLMYRLNQSLCFVAAPLPATAVSLMKPSRVLRYGKLSVASCEAFVWFCARRVLGLIVIKPRTHLLYSSLVCLSVRTNNCAGVTCQNGGICFHDGLSFTCRCAVGFTGKYCQSKSSVGFDN